MRIAKLKLTAVVVVASGFVALAGVGTGYALTRPGPPVVIPHAPEVPVIVVQADKPKTEEPKPEEWTPIPQAPKDGKGPRYGRVPTAFPDLEPPDPRKEMDFFTKVTKMCPRILGEDPPAVAAADDTYRRLLRARLHQGRLYLKEIQGVIRIGMWNPVFFSELFICLNDMRATALELWGDDPKVLIPWLEEFVIMGKVNEQFIRIRVEAGSDPPQNLYAAQAVPARGRSGAVEGQEREAGSAGGSEENVSERERRVPEFIRRATLP